MRQLCAWCGKLIGAVPGDMKSRDGKPLDSHGICKECKERFFGRLQELKDERDEELYGKQETKPGRRGGISTHPSLAAPRPAKEKPLWRMRDEQG